MKKILTLMAITAVVGCSSGKVSSPIYENTALGKENIKIAVLPFTNYTGNANAGRIISTMFVAELQDIKTLDVMEEIPSDNTLSKASVDIQKIHEIGYAASAARALGVDAVLYGAVSEYGYKLSLREEAAVSISARLVSQDGNLLWSLASSDQEGFWSRSSLGIVAQNLVSDMVDYLD